MDIQRIVKALLAADLTQAEIAKAVECSQPTICVIASGQVGKTRPSYRLVVALQALAKAHGIGENGEVCFAPVLPPPAPANPPPPSPSQVPA